MGERNAVHGEQAGALRTLRKDKIPIADKRRCAALRKMPCDHGKLLIPREIDDAPRTSGPHRGDQGIRSVEHGAAGGTQAIDHHPFDPGQIMDGFHPVEAQVIPRADIRHHGDIGHIHGQALPKDSSPGGFQYRGLHPPVLQNFPRALRSAAIPGLNAAAVDENPLGTRHSDQFAIGLQQVCQEPGHGGLAIDPRHGKHRDAGGFGIGKQGVQGRMGIHIRLRPIIRNPNRADAPSFGVQGDPQVAGLDDHFGRIETHHPCCVRRVGGDVRMNRFDTKNLICFGNAGNAPAGDEKAERGETGRSGTRNPRCFNQAAGELVILRDGLRHGARKIDAPAEGPALVCSVPELHQPGVCPQDRGGDPAFASRLKPRVHSRMSLESPPDFP